MDEPTPRTEQPSCRRCAACNGRSEVADDVAIDPLPEGFGTAAALFLLFFVPAAAALLGAAAFAHTAVGQWLGCIGGLAAGMIAAVVVAGLLRNIDQG